MFCEMIEFKSLKIQNSGDLLSYFKENDSIYDNQSTSSLIVLKIENNISCCVISAKISTEENKTIERIINLIFIKNIPFFFIETDTDTFIKLNIIQLFNNFFSNLFIFKTHVFYIKEEWNILKQADSIFFYEIITKDGELKKSNEIVKKYLSCPINISKIGIKLNKKSFPIRFSNYFMQFSPRMSNGDICQYLNKIELFGSVNH